LASANAVLDVLGRQRRDRQRRPGQVDALARRDHAAHLGAARHPAVARLDHAQPDEAVVDQNLGTVAHDRCQTRKRQLEIARSALAGRCQHDHVAGID